MIQPLNYLRIDYGFPYLMSKLKILHLATKPIK